MCALEKGTSNWFETIQQIICVVIKMINSFVWTPILKIQPVGAFPDFMLCHELQVKAGNDAT